MAIQAAYATTVHKVPGSSIPPSCSPSFAARIEFEGARDDLHLRHPGAKEACVMGHVRMAGSAPPPSVAPSSRTKKSRRDFFLCVVICSRMPYDVSACAFVNVQGILRWRDPTIQAQCTFSWGHPNEPYAQESEFECTAFSSGYPWYLGTARRIHPAVCTLIGFGIISYPQSHLVLVNAWQQDPKSTH